MALQVPPTFAPFFLAQSLALEAFREALVWVLYLRVLPHSSTPAILSKTRLRMRLWTSRMRFTRATRPQ
jgi:hypothetical protein